MNNTILIVDDNPKNLQLAASVLNPYYRLLLADNGEKGIKTAELKIPDLILLDIMMPGMNGFEVCKLLKQNEKTKDIPIIFLTAKTEEDDISNAFDAGGVDYIIKPFKIKEILSRVKTHIDLRRAQLALLNQNQELKELIAERDKFFSIIAHDLRGPFQGFLGLTEMFVEDFDSFDETEFKELSNSMNTVARNLFRLLENLLTWSRSKRGLVDFKPEEINIRYIVENNILLLNERADTKNIDLVVDIDDEINLTADENMLETIIRNLISNAIKFTNKGGKVTIGAKMVSEKMIEISVKDTGIGMPPIVLNSLFKIDSVVKNEGTDGEASTGLGLLLCKEFIEKHNGRIEVESEEKVGSTFRILLPFKKV